MPLVQTRGAASAQGFGEFAQAAAVPNYIEDVFSTYLYTGNDTSGTTTQTITNNIDLSTKGGLVWVKWRSGAVGSGNHVLVDTTRGVNKFISSNSTAAEATQDTVSAFNTTGFTLLGAGGGKTNYSGDLYASWTFRKQPKFFDVVTYTGNGVAGRTVAHNLGSVPGCIIVKCTGGSSGESWNVYHRSLGNNALMYLNSTDSVFQPNSNWNNTTPTSTEFTVSAAGGVNYNGFTYVAYLFAHNAGGFGLTGTDNVISCGSYTTNASAVGSATLGFEPQLLLVKNSTGVGEWYIVDNMRGWGMTQAPTLRPNSSGIEDVAGFGGTLIPTATGFVDNGAIAVSSTLIYIAIRRGPMKVPTLGTSVFSPVLNGAGTAFNVGFVPDMNFTMPRNGTSQNMNGSRLVGNANRLETNQTGAEQSYPDTFIWNGASNTFIQNIVGGTPINLMLGRAPGFFDEVCYPGSGSSPQVLTHNLTVTPEMMIVKDRGASTNWYVYTAAVGNTKAIYLDGAGAPVTSAVFWNNTSPTSTQFTVGSFPSSAGNYVAYLFATCAGVSKVGSYTGNGTTQTINCGFGAGGARFVLIKRTDSTGNWYVYDTARGMTVVTDPYLIFNNSGTFAAVEVATLGSVTTVSTGFALNSAILAAINVSAGTYIFLAIS